MKLCWVTINVRDMESSMRFYTDVIGLVEDRRLSLMPGTAIVFLKDGDTVIELIHNDKNLNPQHSKEISLGFEVESLDKKMAELKAMDGITISGPFKPNPHVSFMYIEDPDGVKIQFVENSKTT